VAIAAPREHEHRAGPADVELRAAQGAGTERAGQPQPELVPAQDRAGTRRSRISVTGLDSDTLCPAGVVAAHDVDGVEAAAHVERGGQVRKRDLVLPRGMRVARGAVVRARDEVRPVGTAPDGGGGACVAAAVGVEQRLRRLTIEGEDDAGRAGDGLR
jgi:hypothetical protein